MIKITTQELRSGLGQLLKQLSQGARRVLITRRGRSVAALISPQELGRLEECEQLVWSTLAWHGRQSTIKRIGWHEVKGQALEPRSLPVWLLPEVERMFQRSDQQNDWATIFEELSRREGPDSAQLLDGPLKLYAVDLGPERLVYTPNSSEVTLWLLMRWDEIAAAWEKMFGP